MDHHVEGSGMIPLSHPGVTTIIFSSPYEKERGQPSRGPVRCEILEPIIAWFYV